MSPIDAYLAELRGALRFRFVLRHRMLVEAEAHLRESAAASSEREAVERFGPPGLVAAELARAAAPAALVRAALLLLGALVAFVLPLYAIPENTLPPAPWAERPEYLTWKLHATLGAFGVALVLGVLAIGAGWRRLTRSAFALLVGSAAALAASGGLGAVLTVQWARAVPGSGATVALVLPATALLVLLGAASVALAALYVLPNSKRVAVRG
jgi:hypothetical protein